MGFVNLSTNDNKDMESTNLEAHVLLEAQRLKILEDRITRLEAKVNDIIEQSKANKKVILGAIVSIIVSTTTAVITIFIKLV